MPKLSCSTMIMNIIKHIRLILLWALLSYKNKGSTFTVFSLHSLKKLDHRGHKLGHSSPALFLWGKGPSNTSCVQAHERSLHKTICFRLKAFKQRQNWPHSLVDTVGIIYTELLGSEQMYLNGSSGYLSVAHSLVGFFTTTSQVCGSWNTQWVSNHFWVL